jgi:guanylate kinase
MDLQQQIQQYIPSPEALDLVRSAKIVLLVGIAGAGKDTLKKELLKKPNFQDIVSHTTRPPRSNNGVSEVNDIDYHFIDLDTAATMLANHDFIEAKFVHGTVYGTSYAEVNNAYQAEKIAITDIDVQGVDEYKKVSPEVKAIFILPPSYQIWRERLQKRYATTEEFEAEWPKRRDSAIKELTHALEVPYYHFVVNDELSRVVGEASEIADDADSLHHEDNQARQVAREILAEIKATV